MKQITVITIAAICTVLDLPARADVREDASDVYASGPTIEPYPPSEIVFGEETVHRPRKARRKIKAGALMLGIGWAVPAVIGLTLLDFGETAMGARMLIPYYGLSEAAVTVADETIMLAIPLFFPSIVQVVGTGFLIAGVFDKNRLVSNRFSAAPVLYKEGGGGVGVTVTL
jgi:hypothetical protein